MRLHGKAGVTLPGPSMELCRKGQSVQNGASEMNIIVESRVDSRSRRSPHPWVENKAEPDSVRLPSQ